MLGALVLVVRDLLDDEILKAQPPIALQPLRGRRTVWASVVSGEARTRPCNRQPISLSDSTSQLTPCGACGFGRRKGGVSESDCNVCCSRSPSSSRPRPSPPKSSFISLMNVHLHPS